MLSSQDLTSEEITRIVTVGNPTIIHILAGLDPKSIGTAPYQPPFNEARSMLATYMGIDLGDVPLLFLPQRSGGIGRDILSAALAVELEDQPEGTLLIDLGTNDELMLKGKDKFFATSCAIGPACEGASLSCGMEAIPGAINKGFIENVEDFPNFTIIKPKQSTKVKPFGICGTDVFSEIAEFCRNGIVEPSGAFRQDNGIKPLQKDDEGKTRYIFVLKDSTQGGFPVFINQKDIRSVQLDKGALISGIEFLLKAAGYEKPKTIIIAGAFGAFVEKEDMITLGMIPAIDPNTIEVAGKITIVDLTYDQKFQEVYIQKL